MLRENGGSNIVMETRLSPSFKDTKHGKYQLDYIITFSCKNVTFVSQGQPPLIISYCHLMPAPHPLIESLLAHIGFADVTKL